MTTEVLNLLRNINERLGLLERFLAKPRLAELLLKGGYSCDEVADLTATHGVKRYRPYTLRLACNDRRIPDASKLPNGKWVIPREAVLRILDEGVPPERRG